MSVATLGDGVEAVAFDRPGSVGALCEAVARRVAEGHAIYPRGGATALDYGGIPARPGVAVDTTALAGVIDYPHADMTITVEAGMTMSALRAVLDAEGQRLQVEAPEPDRATLGGVYATNTCGPRRFGLGRPRDQILGVAFATADGKLVHGGGRVVKNVAGYDFPRLLTGSMGTLGILAEMTLKVRPKPEASALVWAAFADADAAEMALGRMNTSASRPVAVELLNAPAAARLGGPLGLPGGSWVVVVGVEDNAASVAWQVDRLAGELKPASASVLRDEASVPLWDALTRSQVDAAGPLSFAANMLPSAVVPFASKLDAGRWEVVAHAGSGIVRGHCVGDVTLAEMGTNIRKVRADAARSRGSIALVRCPTAWKATLKVWGDSRPDRAVAEKVKRALDPAGVMNPGRFVGTI